MWVQSKFLVEESSHIGEIRRHALVLSAELEFDEILGAQIAIVVTELATNLIKHAGHGEIVFSYSKTSLDILAIDKGPGIRNVKESLRDGYSTQGTAGNGLGAIKRQSHFFDLYTQPDKGTIIYVNFRKSQTASLEECLGAICLPIKGETVSGDSWSYVKHEQTLKLIVADGLGHGMFAHEASQLAIKVFHQEEAEASNAAIMNMLHTSLRSTRGAAVAVAEIDLNKMIMNYCGVGNIAGSLLSANSTKRPITHNGTVGVQLRKVQSLPYPVEDNSILIMHSDGLTANWQMSDHPGLSLKHPFVISAVLYRDYGRITDDTTVVVYKLSP